MKNADKLQELVSIARDGASFYDAAGKEVHDPALKLLFLRMADNKRHIINSLSDKLAANLEEIPKEGTFAGKVRKMYADVRASLTDNEEKIYVSQLEETEDRLLEHFEGAIKEVEDPGVKSILQNHMPKVRTCHAEMSALKRRLAA